MTLPRILHRDDAGVAMVEFALIAPVMLMTLFGLFDLGHGMYTSAVLQGAVEKTARNSTIESANTGTLDARVTVAVRQIAPGANLSFSRTTYTNFSNVRQAEDFDDVDHDSTCGGGETFEDTNANGIWDTDQGRSGNGGARDAVLYKVTISYPRLLPVAHLLGQSNTMQIKTSTVLRNQPYGLQNSPAVTGVCP